VNKTSKRFDIDEANQMFLGVGTDGKVEFRLPSQTELQPEFWKGVSQIRRIFQHHLDDRETLQKEIPFVLCRSWLGRQSEEQLKPLSKMGIDFLGLYREKPWCISTKSLIPRFRFIEFTWEIKDLIRQDRFLRSVLDKVILEIYNLESLRDENFLVAVSLDYDVEIPDWREFVLSLKIEKMGFTEKIRLWESLEQRVRAKIEEIRNEEERTTGKGEIIDRINQNLAIEVVEIDF
jgi:hypothetical protein